MNSISRVAVSCMLSLWVGASAEALSVAPSGLEELAAAPRIFTGTVVESKSHWNAQNSLIVTDYVFRVESVLRGDFADTYVLTEGGGTVGPDTHELSDLPRFSLGKTYLLCLNQRDNAVFSGVRFGAFGALLLSDGGEFSAHSSDGAQLVHVAEFEALVAATPVRADRLRHPADPSLPAKVYALDLGPVSAAMLPAIAVAELPPMATAPAMPVAAPAPEAIPVGPVPSYSYVRRPPPPVVFNQLPSTFTPWSPVDQYMMAEWNRFGDVFRILLAPTGTWGWTNGRFDIAGFPTDATMIQQFGAPWDPDTLGITYTRWATGPIIEADVALNPAFGWTLDEAFATVTGNGAWGFRQTMLHELGHAWGLQHPFESQNVFWPSVMNYGPKWSRGPVLHTDDTAAIRAAYPGLSIHDGALSLYQTVDNPGSMHASYVQVLTNASVTHGGLLTYFNSPTLQNVGTSPIVNPTVALYFTEARMSYSGAAYLIGNLQYLVTVAPFPNGIQPLNLGSIAISSTVPTGLYFPAIYLEGTGGTDANLSNNSDWVGAGSAVRLQNLPPTIVPTVVPQLSESGNIGPSGWWDFLLNAQSGTTYSFATCGQAAFDTVIEVFRSGLSQGLDDDGCGTQSTLTWTSSFTGAAVVRVRGWGSANRGTFRMSYSVMAPNAVFSNGFE